MLFTGLMCFMRWLPWKAYLDVQRYFHSCYLSTPQSLCTLGSQGLDRVTVIQLRFWKAKELPTKKWPASYFRHCCSRSRGIDLSAHLSLIHSYKQISGMSRNKMTLWWICFSTYDLPWRTNVYLKAGKFMADVLTEKLPGDFFYRARIFCNIST